MLLGLAVWLIYGMVNVEERYVTVGFLALLLPLFASLQYAPQSSAAGTTAPALVLLMAVLSIGQSTYIVLDLRRHLPIGVTRGWEDPETFQAAHTLNELGVGTGDTIACIGTRACLRDMYWARLAGVRILTEVYQQKPRTYATLEIPNRQLAIDTLRQQGARVLVGYFNPGSMTGSTPATAGWHELGNSPFYALPLNLPVRDTARQSSVEANSRKISQAPL